MIWENHADKSGKKPKELVEKPGESACRSAEDVVGTPVDIRFVSAWRGQCGSTVVLPVLTVHTTASLSPRLANNGNRL